jgi:hypothetical protein
MAANPARVRPDARASGCEGRSPTSRWRQGRTARIAMLGLWDNTHSARSDVRPDVGGPRQWLLTVSQRSALTFSPSSRPQRSLQDTRVMAALYLLHQILHKLDVAERCRSFLRHGNKTARFVPRDLLLGPIWVDRLHLPRPLVAAGLDCCYLTRKSTRLIVAVTGSVTGYDTMGRSTNLEATRHGYARSQAWQYEEIAR